MKIFKPDPENPIRNWQFSSRVKVEYRSSDLSPCIRFVEGDGFVEVLYDSEIGWMFDPYCEADINYLTLPEALAFQRCLEAATLCVSNGELAKYLHEAYEPEPELPMVIGERFKKIDPSGGDLKVIDDLHELGIDLERCEEIYKFTAPQSWAAPTEAYFDGATDFRRLSKDELGRLSELVRNIPPEPKRSLLVEPDFYVAEDYYENGDSEDFDKLTANQKMLYNTHFYNAFAPAIPEPPRVDKVKRAMLSFIHD